METNLKEFVENLLRDEAYGDLIRDSLFHSEYNVEPSEYDSDEEKEFRAALTDSGVVCQHEDNYGGEGQGDRPLAGRGQFLEPDAEQPLGLAQG